MAIRAWNAFYYAFDFTSAVHNAMKLPGYRHVNAILTGAFAEAMYGCEMTLLKKKYRPGGNWLYNHIEIPANVTVKYSDILNTIRQHKENVRVFYPKNRALTNVELHKWSTIENPFKDMQIDAELCRRILKAYDPGWEARSVFTWMMAGFMFIAVSFFYIAFNYDKTIADYGTL